MIDEVKAAAKDGDSLGGVVEVLGYGVPIGLGSHVHWDRKIDAALAQAVMSIQAVKGVEIGDGFEVAGRRGSDAHDAIVWDADGQRLPPRDRAGRRHRGRHDDRRAAGRARGDEAAGHAQPADAEDGRRRHQGSDRQLQGAHRRHRRAGDGRGGRDDGGAGARRRGAAQVRWRQRRRVRAQRHGVPQLARISWPWDRGRSASGARRPDGRRQDHRRARARRAARPAACSTATRSSSSAPVAPCARSSPTTASRRSARSRPRCCSRRWRRRSRRSSRQPGEWCCSDENRAGAERRRRPRSCGCAPTRPRWSSG